MRKLMLVLALIGASAFFFAAPSTAGAANCNPSAGPTTNQAGALRYVAQLSTCSGVTAIRFVRDNFQCPSCPHSGWADNTIQQWITGDFNGWPGQSTVTITTTFGGSAYVLRNCWYQFQGVHNVVPYFIYQIKNAAYPYNWGPLHDFTGVPSYPAC